MAAYNTIFKISLIFFFIFATMSLTVISQHCGCAPNMCCSRWGYCGTTDAYCGPGCQAGPCRSAPAGGGDGLDKGPTGTMDGVVTPAFFNDIMSQTSASCAGKTFYTRDAFVGAAKSFTAFGGVLAIREIAAMLAQFTHESGRFCYVNEIGASSKRYCQSSTLYPCAPGKFYFGRGPIQITWNYNYVAAGKYLGLNLLGQPELVGSNPKVAFQTALWFWATKVRPVIGQGFGATTRIINGGECGGRKPQAVQSRVDYYLAYCKQLNVSPGANLYC